jgi:hypothetical protein
MSGDMAQSAAATSDGQRVFSLQSLRDECVDGNPRDATGCD